MTAKPPILNIADVKCIPLRQLAPKLPPEHILEKFDGGLGLIGPALGAQKLGYNLTVLAPGKPAFPFHNHRVNEEMFFILEGNGELRLGNARYPLRAGDIVACPPGGPETAHQIVNTSDRELRMLAVSTRLYPEICDY
ncbi:MAG: cupin domain-containing protein, partial [Nevskia sp.]|nr:cupin domain-containing protein [Nevskia sp.]